MPVPRKINTAKESNFNILKVVCGVGLLRVGIETFKHVQFLDSSDIYDDIGYGIIFTVTLIALFSKASYKLIIGIFYLPIIVLMCLTLFLESGLASPLENNIHIGLMIITLTMRSSDALKFSIYLILGTVISLVAVEWEHGFLDSYTDYSTSSFNYIFMALGAIFVTFYAKSKFESNRGKLSDIRLELIENRILLESSRTQLESQTLKLERLNAELERKVNERAVLLSSQREAMKKYLDVTLKELQGDYQEVRRLAQGVIQKPKDDVSQMMSKSLQNLDDEITSLVHKLQSEK